MSAQIVVRGARQHNLKNIDVAFPRDCLVVIAGPSGSGKSSLAFDTIYAEAQRRYLESLSVHARQFLGRLPKPDVDLIEGLSPAIGVPLRELGRGPQSTVGTATEILDLLRLLFARVADQHCPRCGALVTALSAAQMVERVLSLPLGERFSVRAPIFRDQPGEHRETLERLRREGYARVVVDGKLRELAGLTALAGSKPHTLHVDIDRLAVKPDARSRLHDSLELGLRAGQGVVYVVQEHGGTLVMSEHNVCTACGLALGELSPSSPAWDSLRIASRNLRELCELELEALQHFLQAAVWAGVRAAIAEPILAEVQTRLRVLLDLGLGYLSLGRESGSLSRGEAERIRLASQLGAGLCGVLYVLDEPTTGLHARDTERLLRTLTALRDRGNTVLVVEHELDFIAAADFVIDLGPGAGPRGGRVMASGKPHEVAAVLDAPTGSYLAGKRGLRSRTPRVVSGAAMLRIRGARTHNLVNVDADIPLGCLTCVSGVSGSGKSSLVMHTLLPAARAQLRREVVGTSACVQGLERIARVVHVDQSPIGRSSRSNPATYAGAFTWIRELFAGLPEARTRGFDAKRFSFNLKGGRCEHCQGEGVVRIPMQFLPDVYASCDVCGGSRYEPETREVRYRGHDISMVLRCTVDEASDLLGQFPKVAEALGGLRAVGLGYLQLGQSATTLSVGEAQRLRLGRELARRDGAPTLYLLDEPTAGLHPSEVTLLLEVLDGLLHAGHTVVVVEHNLDLVRMADYVIDMGPEAGAQGGKVVVAGTPAVVAGCSESHTGRYLAQRMQVRP